MVDGTAGYETGRAHPGDLSGGTYGEDEARGEAQAAQAGRRLAVIMTISATMLRWARHQGWW
jgi:hypothetical protein